MQIVKDWYKSSRSVQPHQNCVETRFFEDGSVDVRNSKSPEAGLVRFTRGEWEAFIAGAKDGEFDAI